MNHSIIGTCQSMCPVAEGKLRERERLLSVLEMQNETKHLKHPKADPAKIVKSYKRSSAGISMSDPSNLRPGPVLLFTLEYLLKKVIVRKDVNWTVIYEFIFDRLRAIRQDMVIQNLGSTIGIAILEPIVRFHIYASERMRGKDLSEYVAKFNDQHLLECIKQLLVLYDEREREGKDCGPSNEFQGDNNRSQIEGLYLLLYIGDTTALLRGLSLPIKYRKSPHVDSALKISFAWFLRNYVRVCREILILPPLSCIAALYNLQSIRRDALEIMSAGYSSKVLTVPAIKVKNILLYANLSKVYEDCELFGLSLVNDNIHFRRRQSHQILAKPEKIFDDDRLTKLLPNILFSFDED